MYREFFSRSPLLALPIAALLIFVVVFGLILLRVFWRRSSQFEPAARMPLDDANEASHG